VSPRAGLVKSRSLSDGQVIHLGLADADLVRSVRLLGHLGAARIIAEAGAYFSIRTWLDARIRQELARSDGSEP
jgi:hypothetical protein